MTKAFSVHPPIFLSLLEEGRHSTPVKQYIRYVFNPLVTLGLSNGNNNWSASF